MTFGDIVVLGILGLIVGSVIFHMLRKKKEGKHCGCGSCQGCAMAVTVIMMIPPILVYLVTQRSVTQTMSSSGIK